MPCHPQGEGFQADVQIIGVLGGGDGAQVPHELGGGLGDVGPLQAEALRIGDPVVALVGGTQTGEFVGIPGPVKPPAVHNGPAHGIGVAVHVFGGGVGDDIGPPGKGAAVHRRGKGVVHDERDPVGMGGLGKFLDVQHRQGGVGDGLPKNRPGFRPKSVVQLLGGAGRVHEGEGNAHTLHGHGEEVVGAPVDGGRADHMLSAGDDVEDGVKGCRLTGGGEHSGRPPLQGADFRGYPVVGGVLQAGVKIPAGLQIKEGPHLLAGGVAEGGGLDNGDVAGLPVAGDIPGVEAFCGNTGLVHSGPFFR